MGNRVVIYKLRDELKNILDAINKLKGE